MEHSLQASSNGPNKLSTDSLPARRKKIGLALAEMAILRGGEWSEAALTVFSERLSREPVELVLPVLQEITESPRRAHETALPDLGTILGLIRDRTHPLAHLRGIVRKLALIFGRTADEELLVLYQEEAGHRTDADLDKGYAAIRGDGALKKMPTPAQFRAACGIPKVYRDGTRPE